MNASNPYGGAGILQGLAEGIKGGVLAFNTQQQLAVERAKLAQDLEEKKLALEAKKEEGVLGEERAKRLMDYALPGKIKVAEAMAGAKVAAQGTPGQQAVDRKFGEEYAADVAQGQNTTSAKNSGLLQQAIKTLEGPETVTGPVLGLIPDKLRKVINPKSIQTQQDVESVITGKLRATFGPQFTENEGRQLLARTYDPALPQATIAKRVKALAEEIDAAREAKNQANEYFQKNGTLRGFKGKLYRSAADFTFDKEDGKTETGDSSQRKQVDGVWYKKVKGGWEEE